jgi:hypothetical protein
MPKRKKAAEKMTDYYTTRGKQLSLSEFKKRIKKSEDSMKNGKFYTIEQMLQSIQTWKRKHQLTK